MRVILEWKQVTGVTRLTKFKNLVSEASPECVNYRFQDQTFDGDMTLLHILNRMSDVEISDTKVGQENDVKMTKILLRRGVNVNKIDIFGFTRVHRTIRYNGGHTILTKFLCTNDPDLTVRTFGQWWTTVLIC